MFLSRLGFAAPLVCLALATFGTGCSVETNDESTTADGADQEVRANSELLGNYKGTGRYATLTLERASNGKQSFKGTQNVQCVRAPCNPIAVEGTWSISLKYGTISFVDDAGNASTFDRRFFPEGRLVLETNGRIVGDLVKVRTDGSSAKVDGALYDLGIEHLKLDFDAAEIERQAAAHPGSVGFEDAAVAAIYELLSSTIDSPLLLTRYVLDVDGVSGECAKVSSDANKTLACLVNRSGHLSVVTSPWSDPVTKYDTAHHWIFQLSGIEEFGDNAIYSTVNRNDVDKVDVFTKN